MRCCFFDKLSKRFLYIDYQPAVKAFETSGAAFDPKKPLENETEMVYAQMGYPSNFYLALMQQPGDPSVRKLYAIDMNANWYDTGANAGAGLYDLSAAPEIAQASRFAFGTRGPAIFYGTSQKIYRCLYENASTAELLLDVAQEYPGYEISLLWMLNDNLSNATLYGKLLYAGLWNPATGDGKLLQYECDALRKAPLCGALEPGDGRRKTPAVCGQRDQRCDRIGPEGLRRVRTDRLVGLQMEIDTFY